jgi:hypothetical protein
VSLSKKNNNGFQSWGNTKKHVFNTYAFPSRMVNESWKHNCVPLPFWYFHEDTHARSHVFAETHPECQDFWAPCA